MTSATITAQDGNASTRFCSCGEHARRSSVYVAFDPDDVSVGDVIAALDPIALYQRISVSARIALCDYPLAACSEEEPSKGRVVGGMVEFEAWAASEENASTCQLGYRLSYLPSDTCPLLYALVFILDGEGAVVSHVGLESRDALSLTHEALVAFPARAGAAYTVGAICFPASPPAGGSGHPLAAMCQV